MFTVISRKALAKDILLIEVFAPRISAAILPGQYIEVKPSAALPYLAVPVVKVNATTGTLLFMVQAVERTGSLLVNDPGISIFENISGPVGKPSLLTECNDPELKSANFLFVAGGLGVASAMAQISWLRKIGAQADVLLEADTQASLLLKDEFEKICRNVYLATADGSLGFHGSAAQLLTMLPHEQVKAYDLITVFGPMKMMKQISDFTLSHGIPATAGFVEILTSAGLTSFRLDVSGIAAEVSVSGPEFNAHLVDFDHAISRASISVKTSDESADVIKLKGLPPQKTEGALPRQA